MSAIEDQIKNLTSRVNDSWAILKLDDYSKKISELEHQMSAPNFWNDQNKAKQVSQEAADLKSELEDWQSLKNDLEEASSMLELAKEEGGESMTLEAEKLLSKIEKRLSTLEIATLFSEEHDESNAIVSIHAGAGGTDAMDWAGMLVRMIFRYCENKGWKITVLDESKGEEAGYKSINFLVSGRRVYGHLKNEAGVHRLVRISPFDAEKMRHTSFALIEVIPELTNIDEKNIVINESDLRIDTYASSGAGGQSVNTTNSAVRITHLPTNTVVSCQNERSQQQNKETAMKVLQSRLYSLMLEEQATKLEELKGGHKSPEWGNQIRSYVLHPYKMVKDHRTNTETQDVEGVLSGDLDKFIEANLRKALEKSE